MLNKHFLNLIDALYLDCLLSVNVRLITRNVESFHFVMEIEQFKSLEYCMSVHSCILVYSLSLIITGTPKSSLSPIIERFNVMVLVR